MKYYLVCVFNVRRVVSFTLMITIPIQYYIISLKGFKVKLIS